MSKTSNLVLDFKGRGSDITYTAPKFSSQGSSGPRPQRPDSNVPRDPAGVPLEGGRFTTLDELYKEHPSLRPGALLSREQAYEMIGYLMAGTENRDPHQVRGTPPTTEEISKIMTLKSNESFIFKTPLYNDERDAQILETARLRDKITVSDSGEPCPVCKSTQTTFTLVQTRAGDEMATAKYSCIKGHHW